MKDFPYFDASARLREIQTKRAKPANPPMLPTCTDLSRISTETSHLTEAPLQCEPKWQTLLLALIFEVLNSDFPWWIQGYIVPADHYSEGITLLWTTQDTS